MTGGESVWRAIALVAALALLASACAAPSQHYGIALASGAATAAHNGGHGMVIPMIVEPKIEGRVS